MVDQIIAITTAMAPPFAARRRPAVQAYTARFGKSVEEFLAPLGPFVTPEVAGAAMVKLVLADAAASPPGYLLTGAGLEPLR